MNSPDRIILSKSIEIREILVDMEKFLDLGLWGYFFSALAQLEDILEERDNHF